MFLFGTHSYRLDLTLTYMRSFGKAEIWTKHNLCPLLGDVDVIILIILPQ